MQHIAEVSEFFHIVTANDINILVLTLPRHYSLHAQGQIQRRPSDLLQHLQGDLHFRRSMHNWLPLPWRRDWSCLPWRKPSQDYRTSTVRALFKSRHHHHHHPHLHHHHLYYFTCRQADIVDLQSQQASLLEVRHRGLQVHHPRIPMYREHRYGAPSRVLNAVPVQETPNIGAFTRFTWRILDSKVD